MIFCTDLVLKIFIRNLKFKISLKKFTVFILVTALATHAQVLIFILCLLQTNLIFQWDRSTYLFLRQLQIYNIRPA